MEVKPGTRIAIVGQTGAGKTTLVNLLMRFYDVDSGTIQIDGIDINKITRTVCGGISEWCCRIHGCSEAPSAIILLMANRMRQRKRS